MKARRKWGGKDSVCVGPLDPDNYDQGRAHDLENGDDTHKLTLAAHPTSSDFLPSLGSGPRELQSWLRERPDVVVSLFAWSFS